MRDTPPKPANCVCVEDRCQYILTTIPPSGREITRCLIDQSRPRTSATPTMLCKLWGCAWREVDRAGPLCSTQRMVECRRCHGASCVVITARTTPGSRSETGNTP